MAKHLPSLFAGAIITLIVFAVSALLPRNQEARAPEQSLPTPTATATAVPRLQTITGNILLLDRDAGWNADDSCAGRNAESDILGGTQIVVRNAANNVIAVTRLQTGRGYPVEGEEGLYDCVFVFQLAPVPDTEFYQIQIGGRSAVIFSRADMEQLGWVLTTRIGNR